MRLRALGLLVTLSFGILVAPLIAEAQQAMKVYRIGWLRPGSSPSGPDPALEDFRQGLRDLGSVEGQNLVNEVRYAEGREERLHELAAELVRLQMDVIVAGGSAPTRAAQHATAPTYRRILHHCGAFQADGPLTLGVTATPERSDMARLSEIWQEVVYEQSLLALITAGYLANLRAVQVLLQVNAARKCKARFAPPPPAGAAGSPAARGGARAGQAPPLLGDEGPEEGHSCPACVSSCLTIY